MHPWRITKINNETHEVEAQHPDGRVLNFSIPIEHQTSKLRKEHIDNTINDHENNKSIFSKINKALMKTPLSVKVFFMIENIILWSIILVWGLK